MPQEEYPAAAISVNAAAKKYGIPQRTLARWAAKGRIKVLVHPERHGQKMLVDEISVIAAAGHYRPYWRPVSPTDDESSPAPYRYCPYCGRRLTDHPKPSP